VIAPTIPRWYRFRSVKSPALPPARPVATTGREPRPNPSHPALPPALQAALEALKDTAP